MPTTHPRNRAVHLLQSGMRLVVLALASYGLLYFSYKYHLPWMGASDFADYYPMYLHPLDLSAADAPFVLRQLSAILTHGVYALGIYYPTDIAFHSVGYDQHVFFAALFANYLCLLATAWLSGRAVNTFTGHRGLAWPLLAGLLCLASFFTQATVLTGLTQGMDWLLMMAAFLAYIHHRIIPFAIILALAIFQRETILIAWGVIAAIGLIGHAPAERRFHLQALAGATLCFVAYITLRTTLHDIDGYAHQLSPHLLLNNLTHFRLTRDMVFQGLLSQNLLILYLLATLAAFVIRRQTPEAGGNDPSQRLWLPAILAVFVTLFVISAATGIGPNAGRISALVAPLCAVLAALALRQLDAHVIQPQQR